MIRVLTADGPNAITITVDGQLVQECVEAVETSSKQAMGAGRPVRLYLRDVSHIDERGRSLLSRLAGQGVHLSAAGVYSSYVVGEIVQEQAKRAGRRNKVNGGVTG